MAWARIVRKFTGLLDIVAAALISANNGKSMALTWNNTAQTLTATPDPNFDSLTVNDTTGSTNTTTGALKVAGGVGVQGNINGLIFKTSGTNGQIIGNVNTAPIATGDNWIAQGVSAGFRNTTGDNWIAQGYQAGRDNTTGYNWIAQGYQAGISNTTGYNWIAQGTQAGFRNTTGYQWIAQGYQAGQNSTTGHNWIAQGVNAGQNNTTGYNWIAQGVNAGQNNTTGFQWIAQGASAGRFNTTGDNWIAQGYQAGRNNTTGDKWIAQGVNAGYGNTTGSNWIAQGFEAGYTETRSDTWHVGASRNKSLVVGLFDADCLYIGNTTVNPTPSAAAHLAASKASRASLRIDLGVAPTSPNVGDVWKTSAGIIFEDNLSLNSGFVYKIAGTQVVGPRETGWTAGTGTADKGAFDTTTATLADCAERILALEQTLRTHGLIN